MPAQRRSVGRRGVLGVAGAVLLAVPATAFAQVAGYPMLDNESIGLTRALGQAVEGPIGEFDEDQWSRELIESIDTGVMSPFRYLIAFSAYAVAHAAQHTPAYRDPYAEIYAGYLHKMTDPVAWEDFVTLWGGASPLGPGNIMYTGHLAYMMTLEHRLFTGTDAPRSLTLTGPESGTWTVDYLTLMASLAQQAELAENSEGELIYSIDCEPDQVFVPCQTPHRVAERLFDDLHGVARIDTLPQWLAWVEAEMVETEHGVLYDLYFPAGAPWDAETAPVRHERISGIYNAWTIWFLLALDPDWAAALYPAFVDTFVARGEDSTDPDGRTLVIDAPGGDDPLSFILDRIATGFGLALARAVEDDVLADELAASWDLTMGPARWEEGHKVFTHTEPILPRVFQNGFDLLGRTVDPADPLLLGVGGADPDFLDQPTLASVSIPAVFVNQAIWDDAGSRLILTLNGGEAVSRPVVLTVEGLDTDSRWEVLHDGERYTDWDWDDDQLIITTTALSSDLTSYIVQPRAAACGGCRTPVGSSGGLLVLLGLVGLRRRR